MKVAEVRQSSVRLNLNGRSLDLHYRVAGKGPPLFLLHPSPFGSAFMVPLMQRIGNGAAVIAPDTPGFGDSDNLAEVAADAGRSLEPYVEAMIALRKALGLEQVAVYGSATGAQIAVEWAKADPDAVRGVMLDNAASFTDAERERIMDGYFPDLAPVADGSHLARAWQAAHDATLFFPWQCPTPKNRVADRLGSATAMDAGARAYLAAGPGYQAAYRAAFWNERAERVLPVRAPLVILRWQGSILKSWADRFDDCEWGDNVTMAHCGPTVEERWACMESHLGRILPEAASDAHRLMRDTGSIRYVDTDIGQIRYRMPRTEDPSGIVLHGLGGSSLLVDAEVDVDGCVAVDLPGHGGSARPQHLLFDHCVCAVRSVINAVGLDASSICGIGSSERIARRIAAEDRRTRFVPANTAWFGGPLPDLTPETSGAHLWRAWFWLRAPYLDRNEAPPEAERLTRMLLALLDSQGACRRLLDELEAG